MILSNEHFLKDSFPNLTSMRLDNIESIHCYHATRLYSKECITKKGLLLPTVKGLWDLLIEIGIKDIDKNRLLEILDKNGKVIFVHMNKEFLHTKCEYHKRGSEKLRSYVYNNRKACSKLEKYVAGLKGFIFEFVLPVNVFDRDVLKECMESKDNLFNCIKEIDITLEVTHDILPEFISRVYEVDT